MILRRSLVRLSALVVLGWACFASPAGADPSLTVTERKILAALSLSALPPLPADTTNRYADLPGPAALGATLFFERRLSRDGNVACSTCHRIDRQFQDDLPQAVAAGRLDRRTMPLAGVARNIWFFWDGRRDSLWAQALAPLENALEHGGTRAFYAHVVAAHLRARYEHVFGPLPDLSGVPASAGPLGSPAERAAWAALTQRQRDDVDGLFANLGKALAAFERTITPEETRFDRFADALATGGAASGDASLSVREIEGLRLFTGRARCISCHSGPRFTDDGFHNTGVPALVDEPSDLGRAAAIVDVEADPFNCFGKFRDGDESACVALRALAMAGPGPVRAYKTPSLRGAAARPPYMHAGQFPTLEAVVDHYADAPPSPGGQSELQPLDLSRRDRDALVAFLKTLSN